jgi:lipopolysaccharide transport system ATP-binding protein
MIEIDVENLTVRYPVPMTYGGRSFKSALVNRGIKHVDALRNVSFKLKPGDRLGVIGANGSGKSTLLRTLSGAIPPSKGTVRVSGSLLTLFDPAAALDQYASGLSNIETVGIAMGLNKAARARLMDDVEAFAGLGDAMYRPVCTYSSGMVVRLAFGIATGTPRDVLLIDEVFAAGDFHFHARAEARIMSLCAQGSIIVMATHSYNSLAQVCNMAAFMRAGRIDTLGSVDEAWEAYLDARLEEEEMLGELA